jgi:hypothetical protein
LNFQGVKEHVFHTLERTAMQPLLNERFNFGTVYFDGHGLACYFLIAPVTVALYVLSECRLYTR